MTIPTVQSNAVAALVDVVEGTLLQKREWERIGALDAAEPEDRELWEAAEKALAEAREAGLA